MLLGNFNCRKPIPSYRYHRQIRFTLKDEMKGIPEDWIIIDDGYSDHGGSPLQGDVALESPERGEPKESTLEEMLSSHILCQCQGKQSL